MSGDTGLGHHVRAMLPDGELEELVRAAVAERSILNDNLAADGDGTEAVHDFEGTDELGHIVWVNAFCCREAVNEFTAGKDLVCGG